MKLGATKQERFLIGLRVKMFQGARLLLNNILSITFHWNQKLHFWGLTEGDDIGNLWLWRAKKVREVPRVEAAKELALMA